MFAALFDADGVARVTMDASEAAIQRTADRQGYDWRPIDSDVPAPDVPHLSTFPPRD